MISENNSQEEQSEPTTMVLQVNWGDSDDLATIYANNLLITHTENEFYLLFGELTPPMLPHQELKDDSTITIHPVAKIAVPLSRMNRFAEAITENVERRKLKQSQEEE